LKPESEVDQVIDVRPERCEQCGALLLGDDNNPERHQVTELPRITPLVTEYRRHWLCCVVCGASTQAPWPAPMPSGSFGPRVQATVGYLTGRIGASQREVQDLLATLYQVEVSVGGIGALEQAVSAYAQFAWEWMGREQGVILPAARRYLSYADWTEIDGEFNVAAPIGRTANRYTISEPDGSHA